MLRGWRNVMMVSALLMLSEALQCGPYETVSTECSACQLDCNGHYVCGTDLNPDCDSGVASCQCDFLTNGAVIDQCGFCGHRCGSCYPDDCQGGICTGFSYTCNNATKTLQGNPTCMQTTTVNPCLNPNYCGGFGRRCVFQGGYAQCQYIDPCEATDCGPDHQCTYIFLNEFYPGNCGNCWESCDYIPTCVPSADNMYG
ncbi:hypothetical protein L596_013827 [Steinernema carpocapsae]|uniref:EGF-like domain-containing protein n=1 Tax=Steinernema carpocapsae TaxID=34508 RepID=A0A4U5P1D0_STECR|nr:hypothetical protein L596_013827 [Steinernema carpocapsae]